MSAGNPEHGGVLCRWHIHGGMCRIRVAYTGPNSKIGIPCGALILLEVAGAGQKFDCEWRTRRPSGMARYTMSKYCGSSSSRKMRVETGLDWPKTKEGWLQHFAGIFGRS